MPLMGLKGGGDTIFVKRCIVVGNEKGEGDETCSSENDGGRKEEFNKSESDGLFRFIDRVVGAFRLYICKDVRDRGFIHDHAGGGGGVFWE
jgi:hypothetical protein